MAQETNLAQWDTIKTTHQKFVHTLAIVTWLADEELYQIEFTTRRATERCKKLADVVVWLEGTNAATIHGIAAQS